MDATNRRDFLRCSACSLVGLAALTVPGCGGESPTDPTNTTPKDTTVVKTDTTTKTTGNPDPKWVVTGSTIRVFVARVPELATIPGFVLINEAATIVVRTGDTSYAAFTAVCTHEGCYVSTFVGGQMVCPCHGSTYNLDGNVVVGPATQSLAGYTASFDAAKNELLITKTA